jgi:hypothetical protein
VLGWTSEHMGVGMDEGQIITLLLGENGFAHIVRAYGNGSMGGRNACGGLAAWQLQRARDLINVNLAHDLFHRRDRA